MHIYDVIIIGAGPVGLATALGLRQQGIENIIVLERAKAFREVGQRVDLLPNGLKALKNLDEQAYLEVKKATGVVAQSANSHQVSPQFLRQWYVRDLQGKVIRTIPLDYDDWLQKFGEGRLSLNWFVLQTCLRNLLPQDRILVNHRCVNIFDDWKNGWVRVDCESNTLGEVNPYAHWSLSQSDAMKTVGNGVTINTGIDETINTNQAEKISFRGRLVVAADGINSTVRKLLYHGTEDEAFAYPEYSGYGAILCGEVADLSTTVQTELEDKFLQGARLVSITEDGKLKDAIAQQYPRIMLLRTQPGKFAYVIHLAIALNALNNSQNHSLTNLTLQQLTQYNFPAALQELVRSSNPANMQHRAYYIHRTSINNSSAFPPTAELHTDTQNQKIKSQNQTRSPWFRGRVVLVGDAAHGMPPFAAQGANQGLEDALVITNLIGKLATAQQLNNQEESGTEAIASAFTEYEKLRRPLVEYVQNMTMLGVNYSSEQQPLEEYEQKIFARDLV